MTRSIPRWYLLSNRTCAKEGERVYRLYQVYGRYFKNPLLHLESFLIWKYICSNERKILMTKQSNQNVFFLMVKISNTNFWVRMPWRLREEVMGATTFGGDFKVVGCRDNSGPSFIKKGILCIVKVAVLLLSSQYQTFEHIQSLFISYWRATSLSEYYNIMW